MSRFMDWMAFQDAHRKSLAKDYETTLVPWHSDCVFVDDVPVFIADPNYTPWRGYGTRRPE